MPMAHLARLLSLLFCFSSFAPAVPAQAPEKKAPQKPASKKTVKEDESGPLTAQRRTVAISLLTSLAEEARGFQNQTLRARVQARVADALWESDLESARALFRRSWDSATTADKDSWRKFEEERQRQAGARTQTYIQAPPDLRGEILRLTARRDQDLSEEFLSQLNADTKAEVSSGNSGIPATPDPEYPSPEVVRRIQLARGLLETGEMGRALAFADKALERVTTRGIFFLCALREKDQAAADERFARMLANTVADPSSDAVGVSVLSSYVFTPFLYIIVRGNGQNHSSKERDLIVAPNISPELRAAFLKGASIILLRPVSPPDQDRTIAGKRGLYFTIARLLPLMEQYTPELAPELRVQLASLAADVPEGLRTGRDASLTEGLLPEDQIRDEGREALERIDRAATAAQRDLLYVRGAMTAARKGDPGARSLVDKISESDLRTRARAYVDFTLVSRAIDRKETVEALRLLPTAELTNVQRVWALLEIIRVLNKTEPARAVELLDEAGTVARRIGGTEPDRPRALVGVATLMYDVDHGRVWETIVEAIKAANSVSEFTGEDAQIVARFQSGGGTSTSNFTVDSFDLHRIFGSLAKDDLYRSIELARSFTSDAPRATATLAVARAALKPAR